MSLLPIFNEFSRPSRLLDQRFGMGLDWEDLFEPLNASVSRHPFSSFSYYNRPWSTALSRADVGSTIRAEKDKYQINLDVQQFAPNEISVKVSGDNTITVEGKHEEKRDEHGFISRHFIRKYVLPDGHDLNNVVPRLSSDGVLNITAPRLEQGQGERSIPIQQTGVPSKPIENKPQQQQGEPVSKK